MIPAYNKVNVIELPKRTEKPSSSLEQDIIRLNNQVNELRTMVEYLNKERSRIRSDISELSSYIQQN